VVPDVVRARPADRRAAPQRAGGRPHEGDRRIYSVRLTAEGAAQLDRAATTALELDALIATGLSADEQGQLRDLLRRAAASLDQGHADRLRIW